jgi:hypothetical protein
MARAKLGEGHTHTHLPLTLNDEVGAGRRALKIDGLVLLIDVSLCACCVWCVISKERVRGRRSNHSISSQQKNNDVEMRRLSPPSAFGATHTHA